MAEPQATYVDVTAVVDESAVIGRGSKVWGQVTVRSRARIGESCVIGEAAFVDTEVRIGDRCKIQNKALVYAPATLEDGVFIGPSAVLTNDRHPRAVNPDGTLKTSADWSAAGVTVRTGASVGASSVCVGPITIGPWAMVAAGAVVTTDVPAYGLVAGTPAKLVAWVGRSGRRLEDLGHGAFRCPRTGERYVERMGELVRDT